MNSQMLNWPDGIERTPATERESASKFSTGLRQTKKDLRTEMRRLDADEWRLDDVSGSGGDPGVVVRWVKDGNEYAVACDGYDTKKANLRETYLWINETRMRQKRKAHTARDSFAAAQLPPGEGQSPEEVVAVEPEEPPHEVLDVAPDAPDEIVKAAARQKASAVHPDNDDGGDREEFKKIQDAKKQMMGDD
jgi:hypothetical protein